MCRLGASVDASPSTSCSNAYSGNDARGNTKPYKKGGRQNPSGEPSRRPFGRPLGHETKINRMCRYGIACRGRLSYCRFTHPVEKVVPGDWSVVVRKRRRCIRGAADEVSDDIISDDAIIDTLNDIQTTIIMERHSAISAQDAMHDKSGTLNVSQDLVPDNLESELSSPTGSELRCLTPETHDSVCALD